jgi:bifunctional non-homologous end joining protein LigD
MALRDHLQRYREKRDFNRTAEPSGERHQKASKGKRGYLIQKHDASREHYDFRLEHDGVLLSWACPKGPSYDPADKRLAVHVEDHPVEYGTFEGTIPKGEYGGGTVMLWDRGTWEPHGDVDEGMKNGKLAFDLYGERLHGRWALVRMRSRKEDRGKDNWLLIKEKDDEVIEGGKPITATETTSIKTGRSMEEIAQGSDVWRSNRSEKKAGRASGAAKKKSAGQTERGGREGQENGRQKGKAAKGKKGKGGQIKTGAAKIPAFVSPQLATLVDVAPPGKEWLHEIKFDGYRAITSIGAGKVIIRTRKGLDWTDKFHPLVDPLASLPCDSALLDGEIAVADAEGHTDFSALQAALSAGSGGFGYYLFDLLHLDGEDLRQLPLIERKAKLKQLLSGLPKNSPLIYSDDVKGSGDQVFAHACDFKLEGIISKRADDTYHSGRAQSWLKVKCGMEQEFVIIGWRKSTRGRAFSSILLAVRDEGELRYCGRVGTGYTEARLDDLSAKFKKYARKTPPVPGVPRNIARDAHFLEPVLVAEVAFRGWTGDGMVRQGSFKGLRGDKPAKEVVREEPMKTAKATRRAAKAPAKKSSKAKPSAAKPKAAVKPRAPKAEAHETDTIEGIHITHPDRVLFKDHNVTKRELADYYLEVAERMLPHIENRPLALVRCPQGSEKECFFQKHANPGWPEQLKRIRIREKSSTDEYMYVEDLAGIIAAVQMGVLELHLWCSKVDDVEAPDRMVFDFDPDEGLDFAHVRQAAKDMRKRLQDIGLESFPMVTGGKGVHVVVPLKRGHSWDEHRNFAEAMARIMEEEEPERFVANMAKKKRVGRIFVDYLRNGRGATAIAPFSTRARKGAHVAWPVSWEGLTRLKDAHPASVWDAAKKLPKADPWKDYFKVKQALPLKKLLG